MKITDVKRFKQILKDNEHNYCKLKLIDYKEDGTSSDKIWALLFIKNICMKEMFEITLGSNNKVFSINGQCDISDIACINKIIETIDDENYN